MAVSSHVFIFVNNFMIHFHFNTFRGKVSA